MTSSTLLLLELVALAGFGFASWQAIRLRRKVAVLDETPTTPIGKIATAGYFEVKGKVVCEHPLMAPGENGPCVYYRVVNRRVVHHGHGNHSHTRTEESVTDEQSAPFLIQDRTGRLMVDPLGAEFRPRRLQRIVHDSASSYFSGVASRLGWGSSNYSTDAETRIEGIRVGTDVYAIGRVLRNRGDLCLQRGAEDDKPFILSSQNEAEVSGALSTTALWWTIGAGAALLAAFVLPFVRY
jgi:hypothetical protein